jgi:hypothetical protein
VIQTLILAILDLGQAFVESELTVFVHLLITIGIIKIRITALRKCKFSTIKEETRSYQQDEASLYWLRLDATDCNS